MMPERLDEPLAQLATVTHDLRELVVDFIRSQRWKNWLLVFALFALGLLATYNLVDRHSDDNARCVAANKAGAAIRSADTARGDGLVNTIRPFVGPDSDNGKRFLAQLEADNERIKANLAKALPLRECD